MAKNDLMTYVIGGAAVVGLWILLPTDIRAQIVYAGSVTCPPGQHMVADWWFNGLIPHNFRCITLPVG